MFQTLRANIFVEGLLRRFSKFQHLVVSTPQVALAKGESQRLGLEVLSAVAKGNGKNMEERRDCDCDLHDFYKYIVASQYIFKMHNWPPHLLFYGLKALKQMRWSCVPVVETNRCGEHKLDFSCKCIYRIYSSTVCM